jgi:hypothetical protein
MRIARFSVKGTTQLGVVDGPVVVSLGLASSDDPRFRTLLALIAAGEAALADAGELAESHPGHAAYDVDDITLLAPLPDPPRVHGRHTAARGAVAAGPGDLVRPGADGEVAVGLAGVVAAGGGLFGATILGGAQGPVLVTADELSPALDPAARVEVRVNGTARCRAAVPGVLAGLERAVATPRPHQPGSFVVLDLPVPAGPDALPLRDGDEVEIDVAGLGLLRNRIQLQSRPPHDRKAAP